MNKTFIFDLDDTLISTQHNYKFPQAKLASAIMHKLNENAVDLKTIGEVLEEIDMKNFEIFKKQGKIPYATERYILSFQETFEYFCKKYNKRYNEDEIRKIRNLAEKVSQTRNSVKKKAYDVLDYVKNTKKDKIMICTRGEPHFQREKVKVNGLYKYFNENDCYVVNEKKAKTLNEIVKNLDKRNVFLVDNAPEPIQQGRLTGINGILIPCETWSHESYNDKSYIQKLKDDFARSELTFLEFNNIYDIIKNYDKIKAHPKQLKFFLK